MNLYDAFALKLPGIAMKREEPLSMHTSFHIGGPAELMAFPATEGELSQLLRAAAFGLPAEQYAIQTGQHCWEPAPTFWRRTRACAAW